MKLIQKPFQYLSLFFLLVLSSASFAQSTDEQMALDFMADHDYDKAAIIYEKLFNKDPQQNIYTNYLQCLTELKDFDKAEKVVKKEIKRNPDIQPSSLTLDIYSNNKTKPIKPIWNMKKLLK